MLKWNVYTSDFNGKRIVVDNIFEHGGFTADCKKNAKKNKDKEAFAEQLRRDIMYYFWAKCEWEVMIGDLFRDEVKIKVDVYDQVCLNWDLFVDYVWENRKNL